MAQAACVPLQITAAIIEYLIRRIPVARGARPPKASYQGRVRRLRSVVFSIFLSIRIMTMARPSQFATRNRAAFKACLPSITQVSLQHTIVAVEQKVAGKKPAFFVLAGPPVGGGKNRRLSACFAGDVRGADRQAARARCRNQKVIGVFTPTGRACILRNCANPRFHPAAKSADARRGWPPPWQRWRLRSIPL